MRVLMLSPTFPWPLNMGGKIRIYYVLLELVRAGHEVTLVALAQEPYCANDLKAIEPYCRKLYVIPVRPRSRIEAVIKAIFSHTTYGQAMLEIKKTQRQAIYEIIRNSRFDVLWVHFLDTLAYLPSLDGRKVVVVLDQHNADQRFWQTYASRGPVWTRLFAIYNLKKIRHFENSVLTRVNVILSVSKEDAEFTRARLPNPTTQVWVVPNGVDTEKLQPTYGTNRANIVLFSGAMHVLMNIDAVDWFARRIFPKIREVVPETEFWIIGRDPSPRVKSLESLPRVRVIGPVEDIRPYYGIAKVAVAPFRFGGGTKLKVLEAMALGVPVVATPIGCQGIEVTWGRHLFVEEREEAFAERVVNLLRDENLHKRMSRDARSLVEKCYGWHRILASAFARLRTMVEE